MNKVLVLKEISPMNEETFHCKAGLDGSSVLAYRDIFINKDRDVRKYIDSFLRQTTYNVETIGSIEFALNRFVEYLEDIEDFEDAKLEVINKEEITEPIEDRFDILDL